MNFVLDIVNGYMYTYCPSHPLANGSGKIYEHTYVMTQYIGRPLKENECVHHIDRDRTNNHISNLKLMTQTEHTKLHQMEDRGVVYVDNTCKNCSNVFETTEKQKRTYCSVTCVRESSRRFKITPIELEELVWMMPTLKVAKILGVSDVAVAKRCKKYNIKKPPRGYWVKVSAGKL